MIKRILVLFLFSIFFISCSTIKKEEKKIEFNENNLIWERSEIKNITFKADADFNLAGNGIGGVIKGKIASRDSATLTILGPFGITIGKAYISNQDLLFYDAYNNRFMKTAIKDLNNIKNKQLSLYLQAAYQIFWIIRNEYIKPDKTSISSNSEQNISFKVNTNSESEDEVEFSKSNNLISSIKKFRNNNIDLSVNYSNFSNYGNILFPMKIEFNYIASKFELKMEFTDLQFNQDFTKTPFIFNIPSDAKNLFE